MQPIAAKIQNRVAMIRKSQDKKDFNVFFLHNIKKRMEGIMKLQNEKMEKALKVLKKSRVDSSKNSNLHYYH